jgi:uncharacterized protein YqgV (UPF0045/DUF77 family)
MSDDPRTLVAEVDTALPIAENSRDLVAEVTAALLQLKRTKNAGERKAAKTNLKILLGELYERVKAIRAMPLDEKRAHREELKKILEAIDRVIAILPELDSR